MALSKIGALWRKENDKGEYFSGELELEGKGGPKVRILVFKNDDKKGNDRAPDYKVLRSDDDRPQRKPPEQPTPSRDPGDDDIPW